MTRRSILTRTQHPVKDRAVLLNVRTKCPSKYLLIDVESGFVGHGRTDGLHDWQRIHPSHDDSRIKDALSILNDLVLDSKSCPAESMTIYVCTPTNQVGEWLMVEKYDLSVMRNVYEPMRVISTSEEETVIMDRSGTNYYVGCSLYAMVHGTPVEQFAQVDA